MHKLVKASIAAAAGIALLSGGAGTFAMWNQSANVSVSSIQSGSLSLTPSSTAGAWYNAAGQKIDIATYRIVPGDTISFKQDLNISGTGTNLAAELSWNALQSTSQIAGATAELSVTGAGLTKKSDTVYTVAVTNGTISTTANATVTLRFDGAATGGQTSTAAFSNIAFTLSQVAKA